MSLRKFDSFEYKDIVNGFNMDQVFSLLENICNPFNMFCFCSNKQISKIMMYNENKGCDFSCGTENHSRHNWEMAKLYEKILTDIIALRKKYGV